MDKCNYWPDQERENPFKTRNANQGPWLIHLANLCVMYECCGTLVKESARGSVCVFVLKSLVVVLFEPLPFPINPPPVISADNTNGP